MASNQTRWVKNLLGPHITGPLVLPIGLVQAGSTKAISRGELVELSGGNWIPLDADQAMAGILAIMGEEVKAGDLAGYKNLIIPRDGDLFEFELLSTDSQNPSVGAQVYWSSSEVVSTTAGTNFIGAIAGFGHYPKKQGAQSDDASFDRGTTIKNVDGGRVWITITSAASYYRALQLEATT